MQEPFYSDVPKQPFRIVNLNCVMHVYVCLLVFSCTIIINFIITWVSFRENEPSLYIYKSYKNHSRLNSYNLRTVNAIDFLFLPLHTTPFLYGKIHFGVLHLLRARIATSDTPQGMNPS